MIYLIKAIYSFFLPPGIFIIFLAGLTFRLARRNKKLALFLGIITMALYIVSTDYFGGLLVRSLEGRYSVPEKVDADVIVVLGGGATPDTPDIDGVGGLSGSAANRLLTAVRLNHVYNVPIIFSGGQVFPDTGNEAHIAKRLLQGLGVPGQKIIIEDKSLNTTENVKYVKEILVAGGFSKPALVTSAFHMERSVMNFAQAGINVTPVPSDYQVSRRGSPHINHLVPNGNGIGLTYLAAKEYLGIAALRFMHNP